TTPIKAKDPTITPSSAEPAKGDLRILGIRGPLDATTMKPGKKIPTVATIAPLIPPTRYPMNVAVVKTGPGVICPTATASSNCFSVSKGSRRTKSERRKASSTYPLPNNTDPIFKKVRKSRHKLNGAVANAAKAASQATTPFTFRETRLSAEAHWL